MSSAPPRERPVLFSGPMVNAILKGQKTQTRRLARLVGPDAPLTDPPAPPPAVVPFAHPGDILWVREAWSTDGAGAGEVYPCPGVWYRADMGRLGEEDPATCARPCMRDSGKPDPAQCLVCWADEHDFRWRPSIHMPRKWCRLRLKVDSVRIERLRAISAPDIVQEGISHATVAGLLGKPVSDMIDTPLHGLWQLAWDAIHAEKTTRWADDPWVHVVQFHIERRY